MSVFRSEDLEERDASADERSVFKAFRRELGRIGQLDLGETRLAAEGEHIPAQPSDIRQSLYQAADIRLSRGNPFLCELGQRVGGVLLDYPVGYRAVDRLEELAGELRMLVFFGDISAESFLVTVKDDQCRNADLLAVKGVYLAVYKAHLPDATDDARRPMPDGCCRDTGSPCRS